MTFEAFCKEVLPPVLAAFALSGACSLLIKKLEKDKDKQWLIDALRGRLDALEEGLEEAKTLELGQTLEALEKEIKLTENERLVQLHKDLVIKLKE